VASFFGRRASARFFYRSRTLIYLSKSRPDPMILDVVRNRPAEHCLEERKMNRSQQAPRSGLPPQLAWTVTIATALAALAVSYWPGRWAAESFALLRFAALFYGVTAAAYYLRAYLKGRSESAAARANVGLVKPAETTA
jgi:hypothetical protein